MTSGSYTRTEEQRKQISDAIKKAMQRPEVKQKILESKRTNERDPQVNPQSNKNSWYTHKTKCGICGIEQLCRLKTKPTLYYCRRCARKRPKVGMNTIITYRNIELYCKLSQIIRDKPCMNKNRVLSRQPKEPVIP